MSCLSFFFFFYISLKAQGEQNNSSASSNMGSCTFGPLGKFFHFVKVKERETFNGNKVIYLAKGSPLWGKRVLCSKKSFRLRPEPASTQA